MPPQQDALLHLETTAEKSIGKEINVVDKKDLNHLDLVIEAKNNRLKSEFFYIYDYERFNNCALLKPNFDILAAEAINHTSARYVVHYLTKELKSRLKEIDRKTASKQELNALYDIFKPSLGQFDEDDIAEANNFIKKMFPYEGCSYTGAKLEEIITEANWITIILSLRIIWSLLPDAIVPWESFKKFTDYEKSVQYSHVQSFYQKMPLFLPSHNHCCVLFEFLEIFIAIFGEDYLLDLKSAIDLVFTAGQICFSRDEFKESTDQTDDDLHELQKFYYKRGYSFHHIFVAYLRSLSKEPSFEHQSILDTFKINEYPPTPYKPVSQKALTLTVPADDELKTTNYFKLISMAANATSRIYSSNHTFTKFENKFLDKFEVNPHKIIEHFFSKSSKNYLLKFDKTLDFDNFKVNDEVSELRKGLKDATIFENKDFVSTFISEFSRYGFESQRDNGNNASTFLADTINFNFNSKLQNVDSLPVRVSKLDISEWFINAWKYETFLGYLQNTIVLKLTKTIGDCDWLIVTSHEKVSATNRYLTPPSSAQDAIDTNKERELGTSLVDDENDDTSSQKRKSLLPAFQSKCSPSKTKTLNPHGHPHASPLPTKRSPKPDLKRISFPSAPKDIAVFENEAESKLSPKPEERKINKRDSHSRAKQQHLEQKKKLVQAETNKPLPAPVMPNQRIGTPTQQVTGSIPTPPPMVKDSLNGDSLVSHSSNLLSTADLEIATPMTIKEQKDSPKLTKPDTPGAPGSTSTSPLANRLETPSSSAAQASTSPQAGRDLTKDSHLTTSEAPVVDAKKETAATSSPAVPQRAEQSDVAPDTPASPVQAIESALSPPASPQVKMSHPYQMFRNSTPNKVQGELSSSPVAAPTGTTEATSPVTSSPQFRPPPVKKLSSNETLKTPSTVATDRFQTPPISPPTGEPSGKTNRLSKLIVSTNNTVKSKITSPTGSSPITQVIPKFFSRKSTQDFGKIPSSDSSNSLSHINDGSGTHQQPNILVNNPELKVSVESIPEIPYSPRAVRESRLHSVSDINSASSNTNDSDFSRVIDDNRESFVGNLSTTTRDSKGCFDSDNETTQDTTKTTIHETPTGKASTDLDGLLEEIKESLDNDNFFSVDDLTKTQGIGAS